VLDGVPRNLPALMEADKVSKKAAGQKTADKKHVEHELGDLLFTIVNLARTMKVDPEQALRKSTARFRARFAHVEKRVEESGKGFQDTALGQMEEWWQEGKRVEG